MKTSTHPDDIQPEPHSVEAEQAVLGGLMLDNARWHEISGQLQESDFYRQDHRLIFNTIRGLAENGAPFDAVLISEQLESRGQLDDAGGLAYLATLARDTPTAANVRAYADIVRERAVRRELLAIAAKLGAAVRETGDLSAVISPCLDALSGLNLSRQQSALLTRPVNDVKPEQLAWLWTGRFPLGKVAMIVGDPGLSKSMLTLSLAAAVSKGAPWPIRSEGKAPLGDVLLLSAEDDAADTIRPRLEAAGADLRRIFIVDGVRAKNPDGKLRDRGWTLADVEALDKHLADLPDCRLVVVDPVSAFLDGADSHKNSDVRELLSPLAAVAAKYSVAVVAVSHLNKSQGPAMYRTSGSLAFVAAARVVYAVTRDRDDSQRRLLTPIKANLAPDTNGLAYRVGTAESSVGEQPVIWWESDPVEITAEEALSPLPDDDSESQLGHAIDFLREILAAGPLPAKEVKSSADAAGHSWSTVRRAKDRLHIKPAKGPQVDGKPGEWTWAMPSKWESDLEIPGERLTPEMAGRMH